MKIKRKVVVHLLVCLEACTKNNHQVLVMEKRRSSKFLNFGSLQDVSERINLKNKIYGLSSFRGALASAYKQLTKQF
jgi:hypothetical protein